MFLWKERIERRRITITDIDVDREWKLNGQFCRISAPTEARKWLFWTKFRGKLHSFFSCKEVISRFTQIVSRGAFC